MKEIHAELVLKIVDIFCKSEGPNFFIWQPTNPT